MSWQTVYEKWRTHRDLDEDLQIQLGSMKSNTTLLEDSFYTNLAFGTAGIRGEIGVGPNRMNIYTVRKASVGLARYIENLGEEAKTRGVVIAYDSRYLSPEFAREAARTLVQQGIQVYLFDSLRTTPELSFAVRYLYAVSGIVITASHNPKEYNGYKVYGSDGCQITSDAAKEITKQVNLVEDELTIPVASVEALEASPLFEKIGEKVDQAYLKALEKITIQPDVIEQVADDFKIVYTPLHGTGNLPVRKSLANAGFKHVQVVREQELPDPEFSTVVYPNPEEHAAFELAIRDGEEIGADILLATDPDADRVGVAVRNHQGTFEVLTGNQVGALLLNYLITQKKANGTLAENATVLKTIVTSELGSDIARDHGIDTIDTLTGFKYIGEQINEFERSGDRSFLFGYEESYGYLIGDFVRDKDAVQTCLLIAEVAAYYKTRSMSVFDGLQELFETYGFYQEHLESLTLKGKEGIEQMQKILKDFREHPPKEFAGKSVKVIEDYESSKRLMVDEDKEEVIDLPTANVLKYYLTNGAWICVRPSGTEPKIKFYVGVKEATVEQSKQLIEELVKQLMERVRTE